MRPQCEFVLLLATDVHENSETLSSDGDQLASGVLSEVRYLTVVKLLVSLLAVFFRVPESYDIHQAMDPREDAPPRNPHLPSLAMRRKYVRRYG